MLAVSTADIFALIISFQPLVAAGRGVASISGTFHPVAFYPFLNLLWIAPGQAMMRPTSVIIGKKTVVRVTHVSTKDSTRANPIQGK